MTTFTNEEMQQMHDRIAEIMKNAKIAGVKIAVLKCSLAGMTAVVLSEKFPVLNEWYWFVAIVGLCIIAWDVFASILAAITVAIQESMKKNDPEQRREA